MHKPLVLASLLIFSASGFAQTPDLRNSPPPPSVALNAQPLPASEKVHVQVDAIPADAKYIIYAEVKPAGLIIDSQNAADVGSHLSQVADQLMAMARQRGANLIVLLSNEHGIDVPLKQCEQPLRLRSKNPWIMAILFQSDSAKAGGKTPGGIHFTTAQPPAGAKGVSYSISLQQDTTGNPKTFWAYSNIARFVADARKYDLDTIALQSTSDRKFEETPLPGCDDPLRISTTKPELTVVIYKSSQPTSGVAAHR